jgi:CAAX protease family protein
VSLASVSAVRPVPVPPRPDGSCPPRPGSEPEPPAHPETWHDDLAEPGTGEPATAGHDRPERGRTEPSGVEDARIEAFEPRQSDAPHPEADEPRGQPAGAPAAPRPFWPGVLAWALICVTHVAVEEAGLVDGLAFPVPLIAALVVARVLDQRPTARHWARRAAAILGLAAFALGLVVRSYRVETPFASSPLELSVLLSAAAVGVALALVRRVRVALLRPMGLDPDSVVHVVVAVAAAAMIVGSVVMFAELQEQADEPVTLYPLDSLVSVLSDGALALAGIGFLVSRGLRESLARLDLRRVSLRQVVLAAALAGAFLVVVGVIEHAESVWLPETRALEDRFDYQFMETSPVIGAVLVSLAAGVGEEVVFRGALQPRLGVLATSALFAATHVQYQIPGIAIIFLVALGLGLVKNRTSTTFTICLHVIYDLGAFVLPGF